jgi:hypothetical protein
MARKTRGLRIPAFLSAVVLACGIASAQQVTMSRDSKVFAEPKAGSAVVGELKQGASAEVTNKQGAFVQVQSGGTTGWTFSFNVNYGSAGPAAATPTPKSRPGQSTIGIRGLEEEDLKKAQFDAKQLDALDAFSGGDAPAAKGKAKGK